MRLAWLGAVPSDDGGVPYMATQLVLGLTARDVELDLFVAGESDGLPSVLHGRPGLSVYAQAPRWEWNRWYSRTPLTQFATGQVARAAAQRRLARAVRRRHLERPYDAIYQFSQPELVGLGHRARELPPIVVHPEVHAAGELRWHRAERPLARAAEGRTRSLFVESVLTLRARRQSRDFNRAHMVVVPSGIFGREVSADCDVPEHRIRVVPNPIDLDRFAPGPPRVTCEPIRVLFVSRISVRKGVEMVVDLSHRISDLAGLVHIDVIGEHSLWSDYRPLLTGLNPATARYVGGVEPGELPDWYQRADVLVQPSHYEPFALTVGEALASGVPAVVSDRVGAGEEVDESCCRRFPAGDRKAFEEAFRRVVDELRTGARPTLAAVARREAEQRFAPARVAERLEAILRAEVIPSSSMTVRRA